MLVEPIRTLPSVTDFLLRYGTLRRSFVFLKGSFEYSPLLLHYTCVCEPHMWCTFFCTKRKSPIYGRISVISSYHHYSGPKPYLTRLCSFYRFTGKNRRFVYTEDVIKPPYSHRISAEEVLCFCCGSIRFWLDLRPLHTSIGTSYGIVNAPIRWGGDRITSGANSLFALYL